MDVTLISVLFAHFKLSSLYILCHSRDRALYGQDMQVGVQRSLTAFNKHICMICVTIDKLMFKKQLNSTLICETRECISDPYICVCYVCVCAGQKQRSRVL